MLPQISQDGLSYERLRLLLDVNNAIVTHLDLHDLLHAISETLRECVPHDFTALAIYDEETKQLRAHAIEAGGERGFVAEGTPLPMQGTFAGVAIRLATLKNKLASEKLYLEEEIQTEYNFERDHRPKRDAQKDPARAGVTSALG